MRLIDADVLLKNLEWLEDYDHYVLHDVKISMDETPTVKAIPIDWILNKYREKWEKAEMGRRDFQFIEVIDELLVDWEKENEKDI